MWTINLCQLDLPWTCIEHNSDIGDPNESKTETIDDNRQDQANNIDNRDQDNSEFESTKIVHIGTKDDCSILIKIGEKITKLFGIQGLGNV